MTITACATSYTRPVCSAPQRVTRLACHARQPDKSAMAAVAEHARQAGYTAEPNTLATGKVFITRHGERADLADERWVATATVSGISLKVVAHVQQPSRFKRISYRLQMILH